MQNIYGVTNNSGSSLKLVDYIDENTYYQLHSLYNRVVEEGIHNVEIDTAHLEEEYFNQLESIQPKPLNTLQLLREIRARKQMTSNTN